MSETEHVCTLFALAIVIVASIGASIVSMAYRDYDHEQMAVTRTLVWELRDE